MTRMRKLRNPYGTWSSWVVFAALVAIATSLGCAHSPNSRSAPAAAFVPVEGGSIGLAAARVAQSMVGSEYRYGGSSPDGFDCSGLVLYSYERAGRPGLPHSVVRLDALSRPVSIKTLEAGDLLFFRLQGRKKSHVGLYIGNRRFVHAPSSGKKVEIVSFDHVYWGPRIKLAGRLSASR